MPFAENKSKKEFVSKKRVGVEFIHEILSDGYKCNYIDMDSPTTLNYTFITYKTKLEQEVMFNYLRMTCRSTTFTE